MPAKGSSRDFIWMIVGAVCVLVVFFTILLVRGDRDPALQVAFKAKRLELVRAMRLALAAASEAQNGAVLSKSEQDAKLFADQAQAATATLDLKGTELAKLLKERVDAHEDALMDRLVKALAEFQQVDQQLLNLALKNSNRKAYSLAFGPAMKIIQEIDAALSGIIANHGNATSEDDMRVLQLAADVRIGVLRIQVLMLPHIAEESDQKMDEFEAQISAEDRKIQESLDSLSKLLAEKDKSSFETATSHIRDFKDLTTQIIKLSRENTDIRAAAIVLKEKRTAMLACQDALVSLENAIEAEPITSTIPSGR